MDAKLARRLDWSDLEKLDPTQRWELIEGQPFAMSSPSSLHQALSVNLTVALHSHFRGQGCRVFAAPMDVRLSDHDVVQPDLLVVCRPDQVQTNFIQGPPDLVVEILSESTQRHDRVRKLRLYARAGVAEYWMLSPYPALFEVFQLRQGGYFVAGSFTERDAFASPGFPDLKLDLAALFGDLPPHPLIEEVHEQIPAYPG